MSRKHAVYCLILAPCFAWEAPAQDDSSTGNDAKQAEGERVIVWDTMRPHRQGAAPSAPHDDRSGWTHVPIGTDEDYRFTGDCVVENEHIWLHLPASENSPAVLWGKSDTGTAPRLTLYEYDTQAQRRGGPKHIKVLVNAGHEAAVEYATQTQRNATLRVAYRMAGGKHWIEVKPIENAGGLGIGIKSRLVVVPSEFGEDFICDPLKEKPGTKVSLAINSSTQCFSHGLRLDTPRITTCCHITQPLRGIPSGLEKCSHG